MDNIATPDISFDQAGICSYCQRFARLHKDDLSARHGTSTTGISELADRIRGTGSAKYDCIIGVSGGVDSTYIALLAKQVGLSPLAVHFDNGWNSELAVKNIENIISKLGIDLHTHVVDWAEFRDLQLSYLKASVIDIEATSDHGIFATLYYAAKEFGIQHILSGVNVATESILPYSWIHPKLDHINIRAIHKKFGTRPLKTFPLLDFRMKRWITKSGIETIHALDLIDYDREKAEAAIINELDWRPYGGKHYESIFTRFYQGYILPTKFGIDKRKAHLSNLICSGQLTRENALRELSKPAYAELQYIEDRAFVLKKFGLSDMEFDSIMEIPRQAHRDFDFEGSVFHRHPALKPFRPIWRKMKPLFASAS